MTAAFTTQRDFSWLKWYKTDGFGGYCFMEPTKLTTQLVENCNKTKTDLMYCSPMHGKDRRALQFRLAVRPTSEAHDGAENDTHPCHAVTLLKIQGKTKQQCFGTGYIRITYAVYILHMWDNPDLPLKSNHLYCLCLPYISKMEVIHPRSTGDRMNSKGPDGEHLWITRQLIHSDTLLLTQQHNYSLFMFPDNLVCWGNQV